MSGLCPFHTIRLTLGLIYESWAASFLSFSGLFLFSLYSVSRFLDFSVSRFITGCGWRADTCLKSWPENTRQPLVPATWRSCIQSWSWSWRWRWRWRRRRLKGKDRKGKERKGGKCHIDCTWISLSIHSFNDIILCPSKCTTNSRIAAPFDVSHIDLTLWRRNTDECIWGVVVVGSHIDLIWLRSSTSPKPFLKYSSSAFSCVTPETNRRTFSSDCRTSIWQGCEMSYRDEIPSEQNHSHFPGKYFNRKLSVKWKYLQIFQRKFSI